MTKWPLLVYWKNKYYSVPLWIMPLDKRDDRDYHYSDEKFKYYVKYARKVPAGYSWMWWNITIGKYIIGFTGFKMHSGVEGQEEMLKIAEKNGTFEEYDNPQMKRIKKNATITPKKAPTIKKSSVKSVKITKKETKTMAKRKTRKRKLSGNALKQTAYARLKSGLMKLVRKRGKNVNTRYAGRVSKGVYTYKLKARKK